MTFVEGYLSAKHCTRCFICLSTFYVRDNFRLVYPILRWRERKKQQKEIQTDLRNAPCSHSWVFFISDTNTIIVLFCYVV